MRPSEDVGWLDVGLGKDRRYIIRDHGRLLHVLDSVIEPRVKTPALCVFLGGDAKDNALVHIFPQNNIRRHRSQSSIGLRYDIGSLESASPVIFADGGLQLSPCPTVRHALGTDHSIMWETSCHRSVLWAIWARLVFLFADTVCLFVDDFPRISDVADFLTECMAMRSASSLPLPVRPRVIVVLPEDIGDTPESVLEREQFYSRLQEAHLGSFTDTFSSINFICCAEECLSEKVRYERLRMLLFGQLRDMREVRRDHRALFSASHLRGFFQSALRHTANELYQPFDFIKATRESHTIPPTMSMCIAHYCQAAELAGFHFKEIAPTISSALVMDHYVPGMLLSDPRSVFRILYRSKVLRGLKQSMPHEPELPLHEMAALVECHMIKMVHMLEGKDALAITLREDQLKSQSGRLCRIRSTRVCLYCLCRAAQHALACGHTICDHCAQVFGEPSSSVDYRFTIQSCIYCLYRRPLIIDVLPPTMNPTILAIDGGGVRGVIPLEFLVLIQENLGPSCPLQDLIDLGLGTSSGGLTTFGLFKMGWNARKCSEMFSSVARRIFHERRESAISRIFRILFKAELPLAILPKWLLWLVHDGCYDSNTFDSALKEVFGEDNRVFGAFHERSAAISGARFGVVATSIAKDTRSCIFGNFNSAQSSTDSCEFKIVRPIDAAYEPLVWEAARATAAAPFFFPTANIKDIGSFQDGGLRDNFAAGIARRLSRQIWPSRKHPARLLSIGTGATARASAETPHYRHVFRDSFVRRSFDAWMASMDTEPKWVEMFSQLDEDYKPDYFRFNVQLRDIPNAIDSVEAMDDYRNLVILQPGSAALAREIAITFLVSRFYFVVDFIPETAEGPLWCHGTIRCKGIAQQVITALEHLHPERLDFITDSDSLGSFQALEDICAGCGRYQKAVSFLINHLDETVSIYMRSNPRKRWRINGFPDSIQSFISAQKICSPFGQSCHGRPGIVACCECAARGNPFRGKRRKRVSDASQEDRSGKRLRINDTVH